MILTSENLMQAGATKGNADKYIKHLNYNFDKYGYNDLEKTHLLSQVYTESLRLNKVEESLWWSDPVRMYQFFPKYFKDVNECKQYLKNPEKFGNKVYGGRGGNNGLGYKYRGRGLIQITFFDNYKPCGEYLGVNLVNDPDLLLTTEYATSSAFWYFNTRVRKACVDTTDKTVVTVSKLVNGGVNGLDERREYFKKFKEIIL